MALQLQRVLPGATLLESAATHLHQAAGGAPVRSDRFSGCGPQDECGLDGPSPSMDPAEMCQPRDRAISLVIVGRSLWMSL